MSPATCSFTVKYPRR